MIISCFCLSLLVSLAFGSGTVTILGRATLKISKHIFHNRNFSLSKAPNMMTITSLSFSMELKFTIFLYSLIETMLLSSLTLALCKMFVTYTV